MTATNGRKVMGNESYHTGPVTLDFDGEGGSSPSRYISASSCWLEERNDGWVWQCCWHSGRVSCWQAFPRSAILSEGERPPDPKESC
jgi:hypothetical protein